MATVCVSLSSYLKIRPRYLNGSTFSNSTPYAENDSSKARAATSALSCWRLRSVVRLQYCDCSCLGANAKFVCIPHDSHLGKLPSPGMSTKPPGWRSLKCRRRFHLVAAVPTHPGKGHSHSPRYALGVVAPYNTGALSMARSRLSTREWKMLCWVWR